MSWDYCKYFLAMLLSSVLLVFKSIFALCEKPRELSRTSSCIQGQCSRAWLLVAIEVSVTRKEWITVFTHLPWTLYCSPPFLEEHSQLCYNLHHVFAFEHWYLSSAPCNSSAGQDKPQGRHPHGECSNRSSRKT